MSNLSGNFSRYFLNVMGEFQKSPKLLLWSLVVYFAVSVVLFPDLVALLIFLIEVFSENAGQLEPYSVILKAIIITVVFVFGLFIVAAAADNEKRLEFAFIIIGVILVFVAVGLLTVMSNRCIPDIQCNPALYGAAILVVTFLSAAAILIVKPFASIRRWASIFAVPYILVAVIQANMLVLTTVTNYDIPLTHTQGAVQAILLLMYSIVWIVIYAIWGNT